MGNPGLALARVTVGAQHSGSGDPVGAISGRSIPFDRIACLMLLLASQGIVAPASAELAWPELCARLDAAGERQPDEVRRYRILLNDEPAGQEGSGSGARAHESAFWSIPASKLMS